MSFKTETKNYKILFALKNVVSLLSRLDVIEEDLRWLAMVAIIHTEQLLSNEAVTELLRQANELKESERLSAANDK